jgi:uncharacterized protein (TIGR03067 family)
VRNGCCIVNLSAGRKLPRRRHCGSILALTLARLMLVNFEPNLSDIMKLWRYCCIVFVVAPLFLRGQPPAPSSFSLSPGDITEAIINASGPVRLKVVLTPAKSAELTKFTEVNLKKQIWIIVADKIRSEPFILERMTGRSMELYVTSIEDALATVKALLTSKLKFEQLHKWKDSSGQTHYSEQPPARSADPSPPTGQIDNPATRTLLKDLQGSWQVIKATMNGRDTADRSLLEGHWKFQGNELVMNSPQKGTARFALKLDAKAEPRAFHLTGIEPADSGSGWMLFSRETNALKIAFHDNLEGRPAGFKPPNPRAKPELVVLTLAPKN